MFARVLCCISLNACGQASLDGTHPHQWSKPEVHDYYRMEQGTFKKVQHTVEVFICHNGDLHPFYDVVLLVMSCCMINTFSGPLIFCIKVIWTSLTSVALRTIWEM